MIRDKLDELEARAIDAALTSGKIEDLDKAASITKQLAEMRKAKNDSQNQPRLLKFEEIKAWAAIIVPFLSIATLAVTIFIQADQLRATREANQDTEWRETVKNVLNQLSRKATDVADPSLAMSLLEPYVSDKRYGKDATLLSIHLLSHVPTSSPFEDFIAAHHVGDDLADLELLTSTNRKLFSGMLEVEAEQKKPNPRVDLDAIHQALVNELVLTSGKVCTLYRDHTERSASADLRGLFLLNCDFNGLRFDHADLSSSRFQNINLKNVYIGKDTKIDSFENFGNSNWWDATEIPKNLLKQLIDGRYPYFDPANFIYDTSPPERDDYIQRVSKLCQSAGLSCDSSTLKYGALPASTAKEETKQ